MCSSVFQEETTVLLFKNNGICTYNVIRYLCRAVMIPSLYLHPVQYFHSSGGAAIAYTDTGSGPCTLLFIHGLANYLPVWNENIVMLQQHYRCIAIDLPGNGQSERGNLPYGIPFFADTIAAFIQELNLSNVCLVGHSMGGQTAITTALRYPQLVQQLVLCAPAGFEHFSEEDINLFQSALSFGDFLGSPETHIRHAVHKGFDAMPELAQVMVDELVSIIHSHNSAAYRSMVEQCINSMLHHPTDHRLHELTCPVLVLFGTNDKQIPNRFLHRIPTAVMAESATARIPNSELHLLSCGHFIHMEQAEQVNNLMIQFIDTHYNH